MHSCLEAIFRYYWGRCLHSCVASIGRDFLFYKKVVRHYQMSKCLVNWLVGVGKMIKFIQCVRFLSQERLNVYFQRNDESFVLRKIMFRLKNLIQLEENWKSEIWARLIKEIFWKYVQWLYSIILIFYIYIYGL